MDITIEQAKALAAIAEAGSFAKASELLGKRHSAIIYAVKTLETQTGLELLDRTQYRSLLTPQGQLVLDECRKLLEAEKNLLLLCKSLNAGWEPNLQIIYDSSVPTSHLMKAITHITKLQIPTNIKLIPANGSRVFEIQKETSAQLVISLISPQENKFDSFALSPLNSCLVISSKYKLEDESTKTTTNLLKSLHLLTLEGSTNTYNNKQPTIQFGDHSGMIAAILSGVGFGWAPEHLVHQYIQAKLLQKIPWMASETRTLFPRLYFQKAKAPGRAECIFIEEFKKIQKVPDCQSCGLASLSSF